jgi:hypothetical protein
LYVNYEADALNLPQESQCISAIAFVRNEQELLDSPIWIMLINIVALEMLRVKLPAGDLFNDNSVFCDLQLKNFFFYLVN